MMMPLFNTPHHMKTYGKSRHKDLCATAAFDKLLLHDDHSSRVFTTHGQSSFNANAESNICQRTYGEKRNRLQEEEEEDVLFSFTSDEDHSSKCKRRRNTRSQTKTKRIADGQAKEKVSVKQPVQNTRDQCLDKEHCEQQNHQLLGLDQKSSEKGILNNRNLHPMSTAESAELISVTIHQFNSDAATTTAVEKNKEKSNALISICMDMSEATDDRPQEATMMYEHLNNNSDISISNTSCSVIKNPEGNKLKAKTFVDKLSKLLAGNKSLVVPTTCNTSSVISVGSSMHEAPSQESMRDLFMQLENSVSMKFSPNSDQKSQFSVHLPRSFHHSAVDRDSSQTLPIDTDSHSLTHRFVLPSALAEHNYFRCLERDEKITDDHSYSLLSLMEKSTISRSLVDAPVDFFDKLSDKSSDFINAAKQPLSTHTLRNDTDLTSESEIFSSKQHTVREDSDVDECCSVLLLSPLQENPSKRSSTYGNLSKKVASNKNESGCQTTQVVNHCNSKIMKGKRMLKQELQHIKKTMKKINVSNSVTTSKDSQNKSCETWGKSSNSAVSRAINDDPLQLQPILLMDFTEETLSDSKINQLHERFSSSFPMQNLDDCREKPETISDSHNNGATNIGSYDNKDCIHRENSITQNFANEGGGIIATTTSSVKHSAEQRNCSDAVCHDFETDVIEETHLPTEVHKSTLGSRRKSKARSDHRTTGQDSKRSKTTDHYVRRGNYTVDHVRRRIKCAKNKPDNSEQWKSDNAHDNHFQIYDHYVSETGLSDVINGLCKITCDSNHLLIKPNNEQKPEQRISLLSEYTLRNSVRRLLKSPLKASSSVKAVYNPRQWIHPTKDEELVDCAKGRMAKAASAMECFEFSTCDHSSPVLLSRVSSCPKRIQGNDVVKVRVSHDDKKLFTVVRNVREAHECQEYGEKQEFQDDVDYMLDGLHSSQPLATRCLSTLSLASKCLVPAFRMHIRAHGTLTKILDALHDAPDFVSLSLCLSAFFFTMSRDRLAFELDEFSVRLILRLLDANSSTHTCDNVTERTSAADDELERIRLKVFDICNATIHSTKMPLNVRLKLCHMTTGYLGMELLLSLTSKHTADWLKETLRSDGGLKHIINAACHCIDDMVRMSCADDYHDTLPGHLHLYVQSEKCLKVLDNVTYMCRENQSFLLEYSSSMLIEDLNSLFNICIRDLTSKESVASCQRNCSGEKVNKDSCPRFLVSTCFFTLLRLLLNITHESERGCFVIGQQKNLLFHLLSSVLSTSTTVCAVHQFDLSILGLSLLMNLVENCHENRKRFIHLKIQNNSESEEEETLALQSLGMLFSQSFKAARMIEEAHDAKIEAAEKQQKLTADSALASGSAEIDQSGQWVESESGLQWVEKDEEKKEELLPERFKASLNRIESQEIPSSSQDDTDNYMRDLHTAGKHMEDSFVAAYVALLIGSIIQQDVHLAESVRKTLPEFSFTPLVRMIRKFLGFMSFTNLTSASGSKTFQDILKVLESYQPNAVTSD